MKSLRSLGRRPVATLVVVATLGIGLGAVGVIAALFSAVFFPIVPYRDPDRLVVLWSSARPGSEQPVDYLLPKRADAWLRSPPDALASFAALGSTSAVLRGAESTQRVILTAVSGSFFPMLSVKPARGRMLLPSDSSAEAPPVAVLSDRAWRRYFQADPAVVGKAIELDSVIYTIAGVAPAEMNYPRETDVWIPHVHLPASRQPVAWLGLGRLQPGVELSRARAEVMTRSRVENQTDSVAYIGQGVTAVSFGSMERRLNQGLLPLVAVCIAALYLIAALNLGILLLLHVSSRARELAVRAALGAGAWGALRPLLSEIAVQFAVAGAIAVSGAVLTLRFIRDRFLFDLAPLTHRAELAALGAVVLLALSTLALTVPLVARRARAADLFSTLRRTGDMITADAWSQRVRRLLVCSEIAVAIVLACSAGVIGNTLRHFRGVDMGVDADRVVVARPDYTIAKYDFDRQVQLAQEAATQVSVGGVNKATYWRAVGQAWPPPPSERVFAIEGRPTPPNRGVWTYYEVGPQFFETMGIQILQGRPFDPRDQRGSLPVAVVNRAAAEIWWPGQSPLGKRVSLNPADPGAWLTVVGVADVVGLDAFVRDMALRGAVRNQLFRPIAQGGAATTPYWHWKLECGFCPKIVVAARASTDPARAGAALRQAIQTVAPNLPLEATPTLEQEQYAGYTGAVLTRNTRVMGSFGLLAVMLALLGMYGVVADGVAARTRELAIRLAVGASPQRLLSMLIRENAWIALAAIAAGGLLYWWVVRIAGNMLFGGQYRALLFKGSPFDARVIAPVLVLTLVVVVMAVAIGGRKALRLDPREGLRAE